MKWIKNTQGKPDAMLTLGFWSLVVVLIKAFLGGAALKVGDWTLSAGNLDGGLATAILGATLGAYVMRRYTDTVAAKAPPAEAK